jgi:streptogramin lyase
VKAIVEDASGALWVGTHGGLNRFDRETGKFTRFINDPADPSSLAHDECTLASGKDGIVGWHLRRRLDVDPPRESGPLPQPPGDPAA